MNGPVIFLTKGETVHPSLIGTNLVTRYGFTVGYFVIPNKAAYMDDKTWVKVVKLVAPGIRKIKVINVSCVFPVLFSIYISLHICPFKLFPDDL